MPTSFNYQNIKKFLRLTANVKTASTIFTTACTSVRFKNEGTAEVKLIPVKVVSAAYVADTAQAELRILPGEEVYHTNEPGVFENNNYWIEFEASGTKNLFITREIVSRIYGGNSDTLPDVEQPLPIGVPGEEV